MKIKKIKLKRPRKKRSKTKEQFIINEKKCLVIGPNPLKTKFFDDIGGFNNNEVRLEIGQVTFVFWSGPSQLMETKPFLKQYLNYHGFEIIFFLLHPSEMEVAFNKINQYHLSLIPLGINH